MATAPEYRAAPERDEGATLARLPERPLAPQVGRHPGHRGATARRLRLQLRQTKVYEAQADLIYEQQLDVANPLTGQSYRTRTAQHDGAQRGERDHPESHHRRSAPPRILEEQGLPTSGYEVRAEVAQDGGAHRHAVVQRRLRPRDQRRCRVLRGSGAGLRRLVRRLAQGAHAQSDRSGRGRGQGEMRDYPDAAKESSDYLILQQRLRDLQILGATATGNFRVLVAGERPGRPHRAEAAAQRAARLRRRPLRRHRPRLPPRAVRHSLRRPEDVAETLRQPILARIPRLSREQIEVPDAGHARAPRTTRSAEAFRLMRTNLAFMDVDGKVKSDHAHQQPAGRGQERHRGQPRRHAGAGRQEGRRGRRRPAAAAPAPLLRPGQRDRGQLRRRGRGRPAARPAPGGRGLAQRRRAGRTSRAGPPRTTGVTKLYVLTSGPIPPNPGEIVSSQRFAQILETLRDAADIVLVDSPAMLAVGDTAALASEVDGLVFLVDMEQARRPVLQAPPTSCTGCRARCMGVGDPAAPQAATATATTTTTATTRRGRRRRHGDRAGRGSRCRLVRRRLPPARRPCRPIRRSSSQRPGQRARRLRGRGTRTRPACARRSAGAAPSTPLSPVAGSRVAQQEPHQQLDLGVARSHLVGLSQVASLLPLRDRRSRRTPRSACVL